MRPTRLQAIDVRLLMLAVFAAAFLLRLVYLLDIRDNPFFLAPVIDAEYYNQMAQALATTGTGRAPYQMPPLYPMVLSLVYRAAGVNLAAAHFLQILLGAGTAALVFALGRRLGGLATALVAAAFVVTSKTLLFLEGDLLATPLCIFLATLSLLGVVRWVQDGERRRDLALAAVSLGLATLAFPLVGAVVPGFLVWIAWRRRRAAAAAAFAVLVAAPILPVTLRNLHASGEMVFVSANGGINFWMGNNPDWRRTSALRPGPEWRAMQAMPLREAGLVPSSARDRWYWRRALGEWTGHPGRSLARTFEKVLRLVHAHEAMRDFDFYVFRDRFSWVLRVPGWNWAILLALAAVGVGWGRSRAAGEGALCVFLAFLAAGIVLFFVTARYRAPLVPVLAVFAARGLVWMVGTARDARRLGPAGLAFAVTFAVSSIDFLGIDRVDAVEADYRIATTYEKRGQLEEALTRYDAVLARDPDHALAAARGGLCAQRLGRAQEAVDRYEALLDRHPDYAEAAVNLANLAAEHGDREAAAHFYERALEADPYLEEAHAAQGMFLLQTGEARAAAAAIGRALDLDPTWEALRVEHARALLAAGDTAAARRVVERAAAILPPAVAVELLRGDIAAAEGRPAEARAAWERGLRLEPRNEVLRQRLATAPVHP